MSRELKNIAPHTRIIELGRRIAQAKHLDYSIIADLPGIEKKKRFAEMHVLYVEKKRSPVALLPAWESVGFVSE